MGEKFDLNSLRANSAPSADQPARSPLARGLQEALDRNTKLTEGTLEERIQAVEAEIVRLESEPWQTPLEKFDALSPEAQQAAMARELDGTVPPEKWDINIFRDGLAVQSKKNPNTLRVVVLKQQLAVLRSELPI